MKRRINPLPPLILLNFLITSLGIGCREIPPDRVEFEYSRLFLPPGAVRSLEVFGLWQEDGEPRRKRLTEGLLFHSDRGYEFSVAPDGTLTLAEDIPSGESARIRVRTLAGEAYLAVMVRQDSEAAVDARGTLLEPAALDGLVNKDRTLPAEYVPADLLRVSVPTVLRFDEVNHLRRPAAAALARMFKAALDEGGFQLYARSGYRSYETQEGLYTAAVERDGREQADKYSAMPGHSEHQTGLAVDITSEGRNYRLDEGFGTTPEGLWAARNAHRFGFILRYPRGKGDITGYNYEPWHFRYVGEVLAWEIFRRGFTLEEFYALSERGEQSIRDYRTHGNHP